MGSLWFPVDSLVTAGSMVRLHIYIHIIILYCISGNFHVVNFSCFICSSNNSFVVWVTRSFAALISSWGEPRTFLNRRRLRMRLDQLHAKKSVKVCCSLIMMTAVFA